MAASEGGEGSGGGEGGGDAAPVRWVRLNPEWGWLADVSLVQPDACWAHQLAAREVVGQAEAAAGLARARVSPYRQTALHALERCLRDAKCYARVRCDAAVALAQLQDEAGGPAGGLATLAGVEWWPRLRAC